MLDVLRPRLKFSILALVCGALCACDPSSEPPAAPSSAAGEVAYDLVRLFPAAVTRHEVAKIDFGTPEARAHLLDGWGEDEEDDDRPFLWSLGDGAELDFFVASPTDLTAVLHCRKLAFEGAPPQIVSLTINGQPVGEVEIGAVFARHRVDVPATVLRSGTNHLRLGTSYHRRPKEVIAGAQDERPLAVQWYSITFEGLAAAEPPRLAADEAEAADRIELFAGSEVSYYLRAQPGDELVIGDLAKSGYGNGTSLRVKLATDSGSVEESGDLTGKARPIRWQLPVNETGLARLTLTAVRETGRGKGSSLSLLLPMVMRDGETAPPPNPLPAPSQSTGSDRPPIIIYLIDALRADHLGIYGYDRPTSPNIDRFAADGIVFTNAQAQSSWTRTSVTSLFTGLLPQVHGVNGREDALAQPIDTMAEILRDAGYRPLGLITNGNVSATFGLDQGFKQYKHLGESRRQISIHQLSHRINETVFDWFDSGDLPRDKPLFIYLHATDPHAPYTPPEAFRKRFADGVDPEIGYIANVRAITTGTKPPSDDTRQGWIDLYDGEIAFNDHQFGLLMDKFKTLDLYDEALIVMLSDHGEEFLDHGGWEHGRTLYGEQLLVPLIVKLPGNKAAGTRVDAVAGQIDVLPTILDYLGIEPPSPLDGQSLLPLLNDGQREGPSFSYLALGDHHFRSVLVNGWKLIVDESADLDRPVRELFRVAEDRAENHDRNDTEALEAGYLHQTLRGLEAGLDERSQHFTPDRAEMSDELRDRLEALGYLDPKDGS